MKRQLLPFFVTLGGLAAVFTLVLLFSFETAATRPAKFDAVGPAILDLGREQRGEPAGSSTDASTAVSAFTPQADQRPELTRSAVSAISMK